jgi:hypothetical protein
LPIRALEQLKRNPPDRSYREPFTRALRQIAGGSTFTDAVRAAAIGCRRSTSALLQAGEPGGWTPASGCWQITTRTALGSRAR